MSIATGISLNEPWARAAITDATAVNLLNVESHRHTQVGLFTAVVDGVLP